MPIVLAAAFFRWNAQALPWGVVGVSLLVLAAVVFTRQRASRVAVLFSMMIALVGLWLVAFAAMFLSTAEGTPLMWGRIGLAAVSLLPAAIYDFTATALRLRGSRSGLVSAAWSLAAGFSLVAAFSGGVIAGVTEHRWGFYPVAGPLAAPFLVFFFAVLLAQLADGISEYRHSDDPIRRKRIARLLGSFAIVYLATHDFLPMFGVATIPVGYVPVLGFVAVAWSSIRLHRLAPITAARATREILETMADALFVLDAEARIRVTNGAALALLGLSEHELLGRPIDAIEPASGEETISRALRQLSWRGQVRDLECRLQHAGGRTVDVSVSISPVSEHDVREGAVVIARDIRERRHDREELRLAMERLEQSNRELEDFAYVASHDLQEPLRKIRAFGDLLKKRHSAALDAQARDYVDRMQAAATRMQTLINDLLSFSRVTTKAQPFVPVDLHEVAREVAKDLEMRAHESGGHLVIGEMPVIDADPLQMRQLLQNLASNGLKFHRPGVDPVVEIAGLVEEDRVRITVRDNGIGFEQAYAERIFTMFERLHARSAYEGTGIGLAICRKIAERHGGTIAAESVPGEGSTFTVTLPRHPGDGRNEDVGV